LKIEKDHNFLKTHMAFLGIYLHDLDKEDQVDVLGNFYKTWSYYLIQQRSSSSVKKRDINPEELIIESLKDLGFVSDLED